MPRYLVIPVGGAHTDGLWVTADTEEQARRLVSLNVPDAAEAIDWKRYDCRTDETYYTGPGVILKGSAETFTIHKR